MKHLILFLFLIFALQTYAFENHPKEEFRAVWLTTALGLDWPSGGDAEAQERALRNIIRRSKELGMNAIVFQVVARGDAMYPSERLPWAHWLAGAGVNPGWDPLAVAIEESHRLGMELHAWYNVYKIGDTATPISSTAEPLHVFYAQPDWIEIRDGDYWVNPAFPELREWLVGNVMEIVENYDIDAIHFDFIRYATSGYLRDSELFQQYNPDNIPSLADWRRENINNFVRDVHEEINAVKPWVKIGSTPVGHYKTTGTWSALLGYSSVFQDSRRWLQEEVHDYVVPQIYWDIGQTVDAPIFEWIVHDWMSETYDRHVYTGIAAYRASVFPQLPAQIDTVRDAGGHGQVYFRYANINTDPPPFSDRYKYPAITPSMDWRTDTPPPAPAVLRYEPIPGELVSQFVWDPPGEGDPATEAVRYVLYQVDNPSPGPDDLADAKNIIDFTGETSLFKINTQQDGQYYVVTSLNRNSVESSISNVLEIPIPATTVLAEPSDLSENQRDTVQLVWQATENIGAYHLQVSTDPLFETGMIVNRNDITDTTYVLTNLLGQQQYYWRVAAYNPTGTSGFSDAFSFTTGFPKVPSLVSPTPGTMNVPHTVTFTWRQSEASETYHFQLARTRTFTESAMVFEKTGISDTTITVEGLAPNQIHYWRVRGENQYGASGWTGDWGFRTDPSTFVEEKDGLPKEYAISQNYPNPFNPVTTILFSLPEQSHVDLRVYDILGREVRVLVNDVKPAGIHTIEFDARSLPSGVYFYRINTPSFVETKRMILLK